MQVVPFLSMFLFQTRLLRHVNIIVKSEVIWDLCFVSQMQPTCCLAIFVSQPSNTDGEETKDSRLECYNRNRVFFVPHLYHAFSVTSQDVVCSVLLSPLSNILKISSPISRSVISFVPNRRDLLRKCAESLKIYDLGSKSYRRLTKTITMQK